MRKPWRPVADAKERDLVSLVMHVQSLLIEFGVSKHQYKFNGIGNPRRTMLDTERAGVLWLKFAGYPTWRNGNQTHITRSFTL